jgi:prevent-host-death family protein
MKETRPAELSVRDLRDGLADVLNAAAAHGAITYVTSRGRRIAAVVPLSVADAAERERAARTQG